MYIKVSVWTMYGLAMLFLTQGFLEVINSDIIGILDIILGISLILMTIIGTIIEKKERKENE